MKTTLLLSVQILLSTMLFAQDWINAATQGLTDGDRIRTVIEYDGKLVVGGDFSEMGGVAAEAIATWDGTTWSQLGQPLTEHVYCMTIFNNELYVAGNINSIIGTGSVPTILKLSGNQWIGVDPLDEIGVVEQMLVWNNELYVVSNGWGHPNRVMKYNGTAWAQVGSTFTSVEKINCLEVFENTLYVGGNFTDLNGVSHLAKYDGSDWISAGLPLGTTSQNDEVNDLEVHDGKLFAAGQMTDYTGIAPTGYPSVASFDGTEWTGYTLDSITVAEMHTLLSYDGQLYCGGNFLYEDQGEPTSGVVIFNTTDHNGFMNTNFYNAQNPYTEVFELAVVNGAVHAVGEWVYAGTNADSYCVAKFDGVIPSPSTSILERERIQDLSMYPNPTSGEIRFELNESGTVRVYDMNGLLISEQSVQSGINHADLSNLPTGVYRVQILTENTIYSGGIVRN